LAGFWQFILVGFLVFLILVGFLVFLKESGKIDLKKFAFFSVFSLFSPFFVKNNGK